MFLTTVLCACVILIRLLLWTKPNSKGIKKLPGPAPLPLLGNLLQIGFRPHLKFTEWAKRYGPIYGIKMGLKNAVIISDYKLIKELFNEPASSGKMSDNTIPQEFSKGPYGVLNSSGSAWDAQRKFTVRTLRNFGFAKASMETMILDEVLTMLEWFRKQTGSPISGVRIFNAPVVNALWRMVTGERCKWEESRPKLFDAMDEFFKEIMNVMTNGLFFAPALRLIAPGVFGWNRYVKSIDNMMELFEDSVRKHQETFDSTDLRDYIDNHLFEIANETDSKSSFYKDTGHANLLAGVFDLFFAGSETSASTLSWALLFLSEHQQKQIKLQKEIDTVLGTRMPSLLDRNNMPYSEAVISEILRITSVAPIGVPHGMISDMMFHGYHLPKGTTVYANIFAVHHDPEIWGDPENFRPERFLNKDQTKFVQSEALIPFSEGKRKCIGDTFAKDTLFLFVTSIFQQFSILPEPDNKTKADFEPDFGLLLAPKPFNVVVSFR